MNEAKQLALNLLKDNTCFDCWVYHVIQNDRIDIARRIITHCKCKMEVIIEQETMISLQIPCTQSCDNFEEVDERFD